MPLPENYWELKPLCPKTVIKAPAGIKIKSHAPQSLRYAFEIMNKLITYAINPF